MRTLIVLAALVCLVAATPKWNQLENYTFEEYVHDFSKNYANNPTEYAIRKNIFEARLAQIKSFNAGTKGYRKGINHFSDRTTAELKEETLGYSKQVKNSLNKNQMFRNLNAEEISDQKLTDLPTHVDWREQGVVSPVKDQGHCGSCWAFASVSTIESLAAISSGQLKTLSTQQLVSCMSNGYQCGGQGGCEGAVSELAFNYVQLFGLTSEYKYSYNSYQGDTLTCAFNPSAQPIEVTIDGYLKLPQNSYKHLMMAIATVGPIAISVDASQFHEYESGVFTGCSANENVDINHAVSLVGYGTDPVEGDYWLVRNSWGTRFGEKGYIRVKRDSDPVCKMDITPLDGSACVGFAVNQSYCGECGILSDSAYPLNVQVVG